MSSQRAIPYHFFRGGTSRGPYFLRSDLPQDLEELTTALARLLGSGHPLNIDGIGGGNPVTTKVAMLSASDEPDVDVDYFFAQVHVLNGSVDYKPTCGNMLVGVGPAAIEMGLIKAQEGSTRVRIKAVNTGAIVDSTVRTNAGQVIYNGDLQVDGVPGTAAPIELEFRDIVGAGTGTLLPTGNLQDRIDDIDVTCLDVTMPMVIARASAFGLSGSESQQELDENKALFERMEKVRLQAATLMGMGDCSQSVTPKFGLVAEAKNGGSLTVRYFMPWSAHPTLAVTGSQCLAACALMPGSIAYDLMKSQPTSPATLLLEHPMGTLEVVMRYQQLESGFKVESAGLVRSARLLARGDVFLPLD